MGERQRLGAQDALWLEMDKPGNLMVVDSLFWTAGPIDWDAYREVTRERLWDRYPVFRSVVVRGEDGGWWWEEQPGADFEGRHKHVRLAAPGGDAELQELIASQRTVPLDRSEPLWRVVLVDGYRGGSAVLFRAHHAVADGIRMVQLTLSVLDATPGAVPDGRPVLPPPAPPPQAPVARRAASMAHATLQVARSAVANPVGGAHSALTRSAWLAGWVGTRARSALGDADAVRKLILGTRNDQAGWTGAVGQHKVIAWSRPLPLEEVRTVAQAHAATVNDVLVTCVAGSLRDYLQRHRDVCHSVTWDVPVNLKPFDPSLPVVLGNSFALVQLELPTNIDDPVRTLDVVRRRMGRIKQGHEAAIDFGIQAVLPRMSKRLYRASVDLLANRAIGVLTNVPGPQGPLSIAGQKIEGMMGWAPLTADQVMSFTIYSYDGKVFVGIAADAGLVPDHEKIVEGFAGAFRRLAGRPPSPR